LTAVPTANPATNAPIVCCRWLYFQTVVRQPKTHPSGLFPSSPAPGIQAFGAIIVPVCNGDFVFFQTFEEAYRNAFKEAIEHMTQLNKSVDFLQKEVFYGGDLLLDEAGGTFQFKLTEINIDCPTGFAFLESSLICNSGFELNFGNIEKYYEEKGKIIDLCFAGLGNYILTSHKYQ
jgi:hypothetical protein